MADKRNSMLHIFNNSSNKSDELNYLIEKYPDNARLYAEHTSFYYKQNNFNLAMNNCQKALMLAPSNHDYKSLWNDNMLKSIKCYSNMEIYKMNIRNLLQ